MTKLALLALVIFLSVTSVNAQREKDNISISSASRLVKSENGKFLTLEGNVALSTQRLTVSKAEKIVIDDIQKKVIIYGAAVYTFNGKVNASSQNEKITRMEYSLGDDTLYLR